MGKVKTIQDLSNYCSDERTATTYKKAYQHSTDIIKAAQNLIDSYIAEKDLNPTHLCFVAVGSLGRYEALAASDIDLIPLMGDHSSNFIQHDKDIRMHLKNTLKIHVSQGQDLTKCTTVEDLINKESIGGEKDNSSSLTRRVLILTEGVQVGGSMDLKDIRTKLLSAYADSDRTSGKHVLTLCNDLARYYRTLCVDYKAKVDVEDKDWATRNLKLRHSRKVWHIANMMAITALSESCHQGGEYYKTKILECFELPPIFRLANAFEDNHKARIGKILKHFALFLDYTSKPKLRDEIAQVSHTERYRTDNHNAYLPMKLNSDLLHKEILCLIDELDNYTRQKLLDWFLL